MPKTARPKRTRVNLRIPSDLLKWIKKYARERNTSVTQLVVVHFMNTKSSELLKPDFDSLHLIHGESNGEPSVSR